MQNKISTREVAKKMYAENGRSAFLIALRNYSENLQRDDYDDRLRYLSAVCLWMSLWMNREDKKNPQD